MRTVYIILVLTTLFVGYSVALTATDVVNQVKQVQVTRLANI